MRRSPASEINRRAHGILNSVRVTKHGERSKVGGEKMTIAIGRKVPLHFTTEDPELNRLLQPASTYGSPAEVVDDPQLSVAEKKAILSSWASDACAVESKSALRQPSGFAEPVAFDA